MKDTARQNMDRERDEREEREERERREARWLHSTLPPVPRSRESVTIEAESMLLS